MANLRDEKCISYICALGHSPRAANLALDQMLGGGFSFGRGGGEIFNLWVNTCLHSICIALLTPDPGSASATSSPAHHIIKVG